MRAVIQRVKFCSVTVDNSIVGKIDEGLFILLGVENEDGPEDLNWLVPKIAKLRIFNDEAGIMNLSAIDLKKPALVVSQFTLFASTKKGNRPSYIRSAKPDISKPMYEQFVEHLKLELGTEVATGIFGADMKVNLLNDGPVTIIIDSKNKE